MARALHRWFTFPCSLRADELFMYLCPISGRLKADQYTVRTVPARLNSLRQDPWRDYEKLRASLNARVRREFGVPGKG
ncbi:MAG: hypothetical protein ACYDC8_11715 [Gammaproteobacteria bacterium]